MGDEGVREKKDEGTIFYGVRTSGSKKSWIRTFGNAQSSTVLPLEAAKKSP